MAEDGLCLYETTDHRSVFGRVVEIDLEAAAKERMADLGQDPDEWDDMEEYERIMHLAVVSDYVAAALGVANG
jgi:hypothetical protein